MKAVVSEGAGIRSVREATLADLPASLFAVPVWAGMTAGTAVFSNHAPPPNLNDVVGRISPRAVFLIYAGSGQGGEGAQPGLL